ncbi:hypothetical protein B0J15DRAFT_100436 [Fusarium solani]|uniref:Uncharacterized protein n=1 Tax=Fusarium solani TaxID=169388 RepID=A0A9P9RC07_FUSSL|nr:uncharacterized protein B0J15DRAFT_100436 [Fusarium solani]KAH7273457.1 hypothetical protein B0J15DRAFT_100436 [Fusarium solani]
MSITVPMTACWGSDWGRLALGLSLHLTATGNIISCCTFPRLLIPLICRERPRKDGSMDVGCSAKGSPSATVGAEHLALFTLSSGSTHLVNGAASEHIVKVTHTPPGHPPHAGAFCFSLPL